MITRLRTAHEKIAAMLALLVVAASAARFGFLRTQGLNGSWSHASAFSPAGQEYAPIVRAQREIPGVNWQKAVRLSSESWDYDLFSAPDIFFEMEGGGFTTFRPASSQDATTHSGAADPGEVALDQPKPVPYRLQLVGYAGAKGRLLGIFENVSTGETLVAGEGKVLEALGLVVERVLVAPATAVADEAGGGANVATAVLRDEARHERVTLTNATRLYIHPPVAAAKIAGENARVGASSFVERQDSARVETRDAPKLSVERHDSRPAEEQPTESVPPTA